MLNDRPPRPVQEVPPRPPGRVAGSAGIGGTDSPLTIRQRYYYQPVKFLEDVFGVKLWSKQREIIWSVFANRKTCVPSGHGVGKTFTAACAVVAFLYLRSPCKIVTTAPTWNQVVNLLWSEIGGLWNMQQKQLPGKKTKTRLQVSDDWFAAGISTDDAHNIAGYHQAHVLAVLDEAPGVADEIEVAIDSLCSTGDAHILKIGNPLASAGHFYSAFMSPEWHTISLSCEDSPNFTGEDMPASAMAKLVTKQWVEEKEREWGRGSVLFKTRVLGQFPDSGSNTLIPLSWIQQAMDRTPATGAKFPMHMGVDIAHEGDDMTVFMMRQADKVTIHREVSHRDPLESGAFLARDIKDHNIAIAAIDTVGIGSGTLLKAKELKREGVFENCRLIGLKGAFSCTEVDEKGLPKFPNMRSQMWWNLMEALNPETGLGLCLPTNDHLMQDLAEVLYTVNSRGQIEVEKKKDLKERIGRSPDYGDAMCYLIQCHKSSSKRPVLKEKAERLSLGGANRVEELEFRSRTRKIRIGGTTRLSDMP